MQSSSGKGVACHFGMAGTFALLLSQGPGMAQQPAATNPTDQQPEKISIAPTMPVPKLPYNMPSTRLSQPTPAANSSAGYQTDMNNSVLSVQPPGGAAPGNEAPAPAPTPQEYLRWSQRDNGLRVTVNDDGKGRGNQEQASRPVGDLLGSESQDIRPSAVATPVRPTPANLVPDATGMIIDDSVPALTPAPAPPRSTVSGGGIPMPEAGTIPAPDNIISRAGGDPTPFAPPPQPALPEGIQEAPAVVPATPPPAPVVEKRGLFGRLFRGKKDKNAAPTMAPPPVISTGPQTGGPPPVAPSPVATPAQTAKNEFIVVKAERGTQFVIAGETTNGQSGILVPPGTVLQLLGSNGDWTTVKSPNGTIGSVQTIDIRKANFDEAIQFISSGVNSDTQQDAPPEPAPVPQIPQVELPVQ